MPRPGRAGTLRHMEMRELDSRAADGILVRLLWSQLEDRVAVSVNDAKTGESFVLEVRDRGRAMDVFRHPFTYATA
jgi:hypothetical protein